MKSKGKKVRLSMDELTQGYDKFIEGKEMVKDNKKVFDAALKKATKPKQRGSK